MTGMVASNPVYVHIGLMKTGTSYLQSIYWGSPEQLRAAGLDLVPPTKRETFHLMLDVRGRYRPESDPPSVARALSRLPDQLESAPGSRALISQESLSTATTEQVARLAAAVTERELHVVLTVRDVARQIPSSWQQTLQSGGDVGFVEFLDGVLSRDDLSVRRFWSNQDVLAVVDRWATVVPPDRIHVVTVPPPGGDPGVLLERFSTLLGVPVDGLHDDSARRNTSIGRVQGEVLRRVNRALPQEYRRRHLYGDVGKRFFAAGVLGPQRGERALVPRGHEAWCREYAESVIDGIAARGLHVVGDLADLRPVAASFGPELAEVTEAEVAAASTAAIATMLEQRMDRLAASRRSRQPAGGAAAPAPVQRRPLHRRVAGRVRRLVAAGR
jgi:hypothetical protein